MISISDYKLHIQSVLLLNLSCFTPTSFFKKNCACSHGTQFYLGSGFFAKPLLLLKCNNHVWERNEGKVEWTSKGISVIQLRWVLFLDLSLFQHLYVAKALVIFGFTSHKASTLSSDKDTYMWTRLFLIGCL